jgi:transcriptional regulator GlxA family with amidase domain
MVLQLFDERRVTTSVAAEECRVYRCLQLVRDGYAEERLSLDRAAAFCNLSSSQLNRLLLACCGISFKRLLTLRRLLEAARLLEGSSLGIGEIAVRTGFGSTRNLQRAFRTHLGMAPSHGRRVRISVAYLRTCDVEKNGGSD